MSLWEQGWREKQTVVKEARTHADQCIVHCAVFNIKI